MERVVLPLKFVSLLGTGCIRFLVEGSDTMIFSSWISDRVAWLIGGKGGVEGRLLEGVGIIVVLVFVGVSFSVVLVFRRLFSFHFSCS